MKRRTYLTTAAAALTAGSGCLGRVMSQNPSKKMPKTVSVSNVARRSPSEPEKLDEEEKPHGLQFDVTVQQSEITTDSTARLSLKYTNTGKDTLKLNINPDDPGYVPSVSENPGIVLLSDMYDPTRSSKDCWKPDRNQFSEPAVAHQHSVEPGETETLEYNVWAAPQQQADCIQLGDYAFKPLFGSFSLSVEGKDSKTGSQP